MGDGIGRIGKDNWLHWGHHERVYDNEHEALDLARSSIQIVYIPNSGAPRPPRRLYVVL